MFDMAKRRPYYEFGEKTAVVHRFVTHCFMDTVSADI